MDSPGLNTAVVDLTLEDGHNPELDRYRKILSEDTAGKGLGKFSAEERNAPLVWYESKEHLGQQQYAVLGHIPGDSKDKLEPVLLNTNAPWSAFLCGSQGSGKSHALSCMLENCLLDNPTIGRNPNPLAGLVFHYNRTQGMDVCEAAYLCSSVKTRVLVSPSNYSKMRARYEELAKSKGGTIEVQKLLLIPNNHLDVARMKTLMAAGKDGELPLYMHTVIQILREIAAENDGSGRFDYHDFKNRVNRKLPQNNSTSSRKNAPGILTDKQTSPLMLRLELLESFLNMADTPGPDFISGEPGTLTIVDLTDPMIDADAACVLFDICLSVFISQTKCSKIVALDEAHNYMSETSSTAVKEFTEKLLKTIREQRHQATRVVIATQEPGINTALIDLCSITMVHRCTSPAWYAVLKKHVAAIFVAGMSARGAEDAESIDNKDFFERIVTLKVGESLLFCPTAAVGFDNGEVVRMNASWRKFKTRKRVTADGGMTKLADGGEVAK